MTQSIKIRHIICCIWWSYLSEKRLWVEYTIVRTSESEVIFIYVGLQASWILKHQGLAMDQISCRSYMKKSDKYELLIELIDNLYWTLNGNSHMMYCFSHNSVLNWVLIIDLARTNDVQLNRHDASLQNWVGMDTISKINLDTKSYPELCLLICSTSLVLRSRHGNYTWVWVFHCMSLSCKWVIAGKSLVLIILIHNLWFI